VSRRLSTSLRSTLYVGLVDQQAFIDVNVTSTHNLLQAAADQGVSRFVYTSTTSVYGFALLPTDRAVWVTEDLVPRPRDIYDITKLAAEELCALFAREASLPVLCLRVARFFPEPPEIVAVHRLCRGVDLRDATMAHLLALEHRTMPFGVFNISARPPFDESDVEELLVNAPDVIRRYYLAVDQVFAARGWRLPPTIDRVYVIDRAERALGYRPVHNFDAYLG
jgi:UDP-glucose 4-epimerase